MKKVAACAILAGAAAGFLPNCWAASLPPEVATELPAATLAGQAKMSVWGFDVYQATLWVGPGFSAASYAQSPFALELSYLRSFSGKDIAQRSISEMRRQAPFALADEARWESQMRGVFPDVKAGDRITGIHQPGVGALFIGNGRVLGTIRDSEFARLFFGIWLSGQTSEPALRQALLTNARSAALPPAAAAPP